MIGYRYGKAPASGRSYNTRENISEAGVSMASVAGLHECCSFATISAKESRKAYYYEGVIAGTGSDDEYIMTSLRQITKKEYTEKVKSAEIIAEKRNLAEKEIARLKDLVSYGFSISEKTMAKWENELR